LTNGKIDSEWINDERNDKVTFTYKNGETYVGELTFFSKNYFRHGRGIHYYKNSEYYDGNWILDIKNGNGIFSY